MADPLAPLARRLGWTPGQAWTVLPGLALVVPVLVASLAGVDPTTPAVAAQPLPLPPAVAVPLPTPSASPSASAPAPTLAPLPPPAAAPPAEVPFIPLPGVFPLPTPAPAAPAPASAPTAAPPAPADEPLRIAAGGWSSALGQDPTVPPASYPVQAGALGETARSFVRLAGTGTVLRLAVDGASGATFGTPGALLVCATETADWQPRSGQATSAAPSYDEARCTPGTPAADGLTWSFDVTSLPDLAGAGLTLRPDATPGAVWRVTFLPSPVETA